jgi:NAD(P)-dependent dehydrogenase (short-subunit alcohol dehydrogenase family)
VNAGRVALVTGARGGIGGAIVERLGGSAYSSSGHGTCFYRGSGDRRPRLDGPVNPNLADWS